MELYIAQGILDVMRVQEGDQHHMQIVNYKDVLFMCNAYKSYGHKKINYLHRKNKGKLGNTQVD